MAHLDIRVSSFSEDSFETKNHVAKGLGKARHLPHHA